MLVYSRCCFCHNADSDGAASVLPSLERVKFIFVTYYYYSGAACCWSFSLLCVRPCAFVSVYLFSVINFVLRNICSWIFTASEITHTPHVMQT